MPLKVENPWGSRINGRSSSYSSHRLCHASDTSFPLPLSYLPCCPCLVGSDEVVSRPGWPGETLRIAATVP